MVMRGIERKVTTLKGGGGVSNRENAAFKNACGSKPQNLCPFPAYLSCEVGDLNYLLICSATRL